MTIPEASNLLSNSGLPLLVDSEIFIETDWFSKMSETNQNKFLRFFDSTYDYEKALKAMKLKQSDVESLRKKVKSSKYVPKFIVDKQVKFV